MVRIVSLLVLILLQGCAVNPVQQAAQLMSLQQRADNLYRQANYQQALPLYQQITKKMPDLAEPWLRVGNCYARLQQTDKAIEAYRQAIQRQPSYNKAWYNLAYVQAQDLATTMAAMSARLDPADVSTKKMRELAIQVLTPFNLQHSLEQANVGQVADPKKTDPEKTDPKQPDSVQPESPDQPQPPMDVATDHISNSDE